MIDSVENSQLCYFDSSQMIRCKVIHIIAYSECIRKLVKTTFTWVCFIRASMWVNTFSTLPFVNTFWSSLCWRLFAVLTSWTSNWTQTAILFVNIMHYRYSLSYSDWQSFICIRIMTLSTIKHIKHQQLNILHIQDADFPMHMEPNH